MIREKRRRKRDENNSEIFLLASPEFSFIIRLDLGRVGSKNKIFLDLLFFLFSFDLLHMTKQLNNFNFNHSFPFSSYHLYNFPKSRFAKNYFCYDLVLFYVLCTPFTYFWLHIFYQC